MAIGVVGAAPIANSATKEKEYNAASKDDDFFYNDDDDAFRETFNYDDRWEGYEDNTRPEREPTGDLVGDISGGGADAWDRCWRGNCRWSSCSWRIWRRWT